MRCNTSDGNIVPIGSVRLGRRMPPFAFMFVDSAAPESESRVGQYHDLVKHCVASTCCLMKSNLALSDQFEKFSDCCHCFAWYSIAPLDRRRRFSRTRLPRFRASESLFPIRCRVLEPLWYPKLAYMPCRHWRIPGLPSYLP